jgi:hypothetical protein
MSFTPGFFGTKASYLTYVHLYFKKFSELISPNPILTGELGSKKRNGRRQRQGKGGEVRAEGRRNGERKEERKREGDEEFSYTLLFRSRTQTSTDIRAKTAHY